MSGGIDQGAILCETAEPNASLKWKMWRGDCALHTLRERALCGLSKQIVEVVDVKERSPQYKLSFNSLVQAVQPAKP
jgi:hypothetical protein